MRRTLNRTTQKAPGTFPRITSAWYFVLLVAAALGLLVRGDGPARASGAEPLPARLLRIVDAVGLREREMGLPPSNAGATLEAGEGAIAFTSELPVAPEAADSSEEKIAGDPLLPPGMPGAEIAEDTLSIRTLFDTTAETVRKRILLKHGRFQASFLATLDSSGRPFAQRAYATPQGGVYVYERRGETILYTQTTSPEGEAALKEWVHAEQPSQDGALQYVWKFESGDASHTVSLEAHEDGSVSLYQEMVIGGVDPKDKTRQRSSRPAGPGVPAPRARRLRLGRGRGSGPCP